MSHSDVAKSAEEKALSLSSSSRSASSCSLLFSAGTSGCVLVAIRRLGDTEGGICPMLQRACFLGLNHVVTFKLIGGAFLSKCGGVEILLPIRARGE